MHFTIYHTRLQRNYVISIDKFIGQINNLFKCEPEIKSILYKHDKLLRNGYKNNMHAFILIDVTR